MSRYSVYWAKNLWNPDCLASKYYACMQILPRSTLPSLMIEAASLAQKSSDTPEHLIIVQGHELLGNESPVDSLVTADSLAPA